MRNMVILIRNGISIFYFFFWEKYGYGQVRSNRMPVYICGIMTQYTKSKCILIQVLCLIKQCLNKISAAYVMNQVGKKHIPERIIPNIGYYGSAISISACRF